MENVSDREKSNIDWVQLNKEMAYYNQEEFGQKFIRKCKENPAVPLGNVIKSLILLNK
jgi:hypothetical protein